MRLGQEVQALPRGVALPHGTRLVVEAVLAALGALAFVMIAQAFVSGGEVVTFDADVARFMAGDMPSALEWPARVATWAGGAVGTALVTGAASVLLWRARRRVDAAFIALSVIGVTVVVAVLKATYERARPDLGSPIALPHSYSFPSGHAATAVVLYGALGVLAAEYARSRLRAAGWLVGAAVVALAIGTSRIVLNVHFVSDVLAGFAVGLAWLCCCLICRDVLTAAPTASWPTTRRS